jgi:hypothetical protein
MSEATSDSAAPPDLSGLRRFVTLVDIVELANHGDAAGAYFRTFGPDDDASLLIYAATDDPGWAEWLVLNVLRAGGATPDACADVKLCVVAGEAAAVEPFARRSHAVLSAGDGSWLPIRRPVHGWEALPALREQAERFWGVRGQEPGAPYSYEEAIAHVLSRGWTTERHARYGSVPELSLERAVRAFETHLAAPAPRLLHVGNFLGISLSYFLDWARARNGFVVSVDPDLPHRGVTLPQRAVNELLAHFGLTRGHLLVCGYSLEKSLSNDSVVFEGYDPAAAWTREAAPENVLPGLVRSGQRFDAAFIDGNHDASYLRREVAEITQLLEPGGLLVLDDVDPAWEQIRQVFEQVIDGDWPFEPVEADGRIGVLRRL